MTLLLVQQLLRDRRRHCLLFQGESIQCSCGFASKDICAIENHLVTHEKSPVYEGEDKIRGSLVKLLQRELSVGFVETKSPAVVLDVPAKTHFVAFSEAEIGGGAMTDVSCPKCKNSTGTLQGFHSLESHFEERHGGMWPEGVIRTKQELVDRRRKERDWNYRFFCPIPGCKYNFFQASLQPLARLKQLRQHYVKVHAAKDLHCPSDGCNLAFSNPAALARHTNSECGREFACDDCGMAYRRYENLLTHGRRKGHVVDRRKKAELEKRQRDKRRLMAVSGAMGRPVSIAPKPSHPHLNAAIALSELSTLKQGKPFTGAAVNVDVAIQTEAMAAAAKGVAVSTASLTTQTSAISPVSRKRSAETQTTKSAKRRQSAATLTTPKALMDRASSPPHSGELAMTAADLDLLPGLVVTKDRPLWTASSTQTSPKYSGVPDVPGDFLNMEPPGAQRPPTLRLGEIEQFSTETQTADVGCGEAWDIGDDFGLRQIEAETQFDLDDILCSNYTQTGTHRDILLSPPPMNPLHINTDVAATMTSIETQTTPASRQHQPQMASSSSVADSKATQTARSSTPAQL